MPLLGSKFKTYQKQGKSRVKWGKNYIEFEWKLIDGKRIRHGEFKRFFAKDPNKVEVHCFYNEGQREGLYKCYFFNGRLKIEGNYKNGKFNGPYKTWFNNGQLNTEGTLENRYGKSYWTGPLFAWYKDGTEKAYYDGPAGKNKRLGKSKDDALEGKFRSKW